MPIDNKRSWLHIETLKLRAHTWQHFARSRFTLHTLYVYILVCETQPQFMSNIIPTLPGRTFSPRCVCLFSYSFLSSTTTAAAFRIETAFRKAALKCSGTELCTIYNILLVYRTTTYKMINYRVQPVLSHLLLARLINQISNEISGGTNTSINYSWAINLSVFAFCLWFDVSYNLVIYK